MTRRGGLWVTGAIGIALFVVLAILDVRMRNAGGPGIVGFELAGSEDRAHEILADWGSSGQDAARASLWIDYAYLIAYGAFFTLAVGAIRDLAVERGWRRMAAAGVALIAFPASAAAFDAIEDVNLLLALDQHGGATAPRLATICAVAKFILIGVAIAYVLGGLAGRALGSAGRRRPEG
jgi:hypothetical protein